MQWSVFLLFCSCFFWFVLAQEEGGDKEVLLNIKTTLSKFNNSDLLQSWSNDSSSSPCESSWIGVTCEVLEGQSRVRKINLSGYNFNGSIPMSFLNLSSLLELNLSWNKFDTLPSLPEGLLGESPVLQTLDLSYNRLLSVSAAAWNLSELRSLDLSSNQLAGSVDALLPLNCSHLAILNLSSNYLDSATSPPPWSRCPAIESVDLSNNRLTGPIPELAGEIPPTFRQLILSSNLFSGPLPPSLFSGTSLQRLDLSANRLNGTIPTSVGNSTTLEELFLAENELTGAIPVEIGKVASLRMLLLGTNKLSEIPPNITDCRSLTLLDLSSNLMAGGLPDFLGQMNSLKYLVLHSNGFSGSLPVMLANISNAEFVDLSNNNFEGAFPATALLGLPNLKFLLMASNKLVGNIPAELGNISGLQFLDVSSNGFSGLIPPALGKLQRLLWLMLAHNDLEGEIPSELGNCTSLLWFNARSNKLSGQIPTALMGMGADPTSTFAYNAGESGFNPPKAEGVCAMMRRWVPEDYPPFSFQYSVMDRTRCRQLWKDLITGTISLYSCQVVATAAATSKSHGGFIQLTDNVLSGTLPGSYQGNKTELLLVAMNSLVGPLPASDLSNLPLFALNISHNNFDGAIPDSLGSISCLNLLDISYNNWSGPIPNTLPNLYELIYFNASSNPFLTGEIPPYNQFLTFGPNAYINDPLLCLSPLANMRVNVSLSAFLNFCNANSTSIVLAPSSPSSSSNTTQDKLAIVIGIIGSISVLLLISLLAFHFTSTWRRSHHSSHTDSFTRFGSGYFYGDSSELGGSKKSYEKASLASEPHALQAKVCLFESVKSNIVHVSANLTYADLLLATNNFNQANIIGSGGFGVVYKAHMSDGAVVAVKKLMSSGYDCEGEREFLAEMNTLGNHVHPNLVPLLGCCLFGSERLLVYRYLANGSLEDWLHDCKKANAEELHWSRRLAIAHGTAKGLLYLHHNCTSGVIHRDLKASNILLDEDFSACLTDFGLARELDPFCTHVSTTIAGTLGYVPPEYYQVWRATVKGDVYSFGVVLLELVTGRRPIPTGPDGDYGNLVEWVRMLMKEGQVEEVYDPITRGQNRRQLHEFLDLALRCTQDNPEHRPNSKDVATTLDKLVGYTS